MKLKILTIEDYDALYDMWINTPGMGLNETDDSREGIEIYLKRNPNTCFAAFEDGRLVGAILSGHDGRRGFISHTAVSVNCRKQGMGRQLVEAAMDALEREGIHKVALVVFERNQLGNAFWERLGFVSREDLVYRNKNIHALNRIDI